MTYPRTCTGIFRARPNRFIAIVEVEGVDTVCHVKNTGRCKELLVPGCTVILAAGNNPNRKTPFDEQSKEFSTAKELKRERRERKLLELRYGRPKGDR